MSGSGISWAACKPAVRSTDNHASVPPLSFYRPDALPAAQPTASKHWRQLRIKRYCCAQQFYCWQAVWSEVDLHTARWCHCHSLCSPEKFWSSKLNDLWVPRPDRQYLRKHSRAWRKTSDARLCSRCSICTCSSVTAIAVRSLALLQHVNLAPFSDRHTCID